MLQHEGHLAEAARIERTVYQVLAFQGRPQVIDRNAQLSGDAACAMT